MVATRATDELTFVCYLNTVGGQDELVFEGASFICDPDGNRVVQGKFFEEDLLLADLDVDAVFSARLHDIRRRQAEFPFEAEGVEGRRIETPLSAPHERHALSALPSHVCEIPDRLAELYGALVLGTRDYARKTGFKKAVIGLSGGIDSSLTAAIAVDALGPENVIGVSLPSRYSSEGSRSDAARLAENLSIPCLSVPIEQAFSAYLEMLAEPFKGLQPDITEENLQARVRGNVWMALSNKFGWLVLTAGNKSELAVGYATLYGDMAGGFSVLKDVYKTTVFELATYVNERADREVIPWAVIEKEPSAELRADQRDADTLPPYPVLDGILKLYVDEDRSSTDIVACGFDPETVTRVISMVDRAEYKRRQAPPGIKVSDRAFGKDRRLPISNWYRDLPDVGETQKLEEAAAAGERQSGQEPGTTR
jgi:NAD+ synthase (glutamine-hydrolysing)